MALLTLLFAGLIGAPADEPSPPPAADALKAYEAARTELGRELQAHVKLALWCEAHGLQAERVKHLALAVLADPMNVTARGLLGLVPYRGRWETPEKVVERLKEDEALTAKLAEYNRRRAELEQRLGKPGRGGPASQQSDARAHVQLGMWCEQAGLKAEATAHFTSAVVLDPYNDATWKHLGYVKRDGRWMSPEQVTAERREAAAQNKADRYWGPTLRKWRGWLGDKTRREDAERLLADVADPLAVPSVVRTFRDGNESDQKVAVQLLGQIDSPASTWRLAELAVFGRSEAVRSAATKALKRREPRDYAGALVDLISSPMKYQVVPVRGPGAPGAMLVETPRFRMLRTYDAPPVALPGTNFHGYVGYDDNGLPVVAKGVELKKMALESPALAAVDLQKIEHRTAQMIADANLKAAVSQQRMVADVDAIETCNAQTAMGNARVASVLTGAVDAPAAELKDDEDAWKTWWNDKLGYRYEAPAQVTFAVDVSPHYPPPRITSCFVAGTPVKTLQGHRPIEELTAGDQVLSQDVTTGELGFQPVLVVHRNAPGATVKVELDNGEAILASVYHRFWRAGKGWAMARELKSGDVLRTLGGLARVVSTSSGPVEPLFNLDVARNRTFFVGRHDALVHDNTLPDPRAKPFDAEPVLRAPTRPAID
jgi:hypothetical protein